MLSLANLLLDSRMPRRRKPAAVAWPTCGGEEAMFALANLLVERNEVEDAEHWQRRAAEAEATIYLASLLIERATRKEPNSGTGAPPTTRPSKTTRTPDCTEHERCPTRDAPNIGSSSPLLARHHRERATIRSEPLSHDGTRKWPSTASRGHWQQPY